MDGLRKLGAGLTAFGLAIAMVVRHLLILPLVALALVLVIWAFGAGFIEGALALLFVAVFGYGATKALRD